MTTAGCDFAASGSASAGTNAPMEGPAKPEYERTFDEFVDVPNQMTAQVVWAAEPIDEAVQLANEIAQLRAKLDISPEDFSAMCTVAFKDGTVEVGGVVMAEEVKVELEATLAKIKAVGQSLASVPARAKTAGKAIGKLAMATPKLMLKSTKELSGELAIAVGDGGAQIEADLDTVKALPKEVKAEAAAAKDVLATLPQKAQQATTNLMAAMKGESFEPMETTGDPEADPGPEVAATDGSAVAAATEATEIAGADAGVDASASAAVEPTAPSPGVVVTAPPANGSSPAADLPADAVRNRVAKLQRIAKVASDAGDWLSAADAFEEAYGLTPTDLLLAYKAGQAANKAHDCARAHVYLDRFVQYGDPTLQAPEMALANKTLGELKTFECAPRTPADEAARAATLAARAEALGLEDDWGGAAVLYATAYQLAPEDHSYAFHVAEASWKSRECEDAIAYFNHFQTVGDPRAHRALLRQTTKYQEQAVTGECPTWAVGEREGHARDLYTQAQALEAELDFVAAIDKYERAYYQLPDNHALAFRIADSAWKGQLCDKASTNFRVFVANTDAADPRYVSDLQHANGVIASVDSLGCPNALYGGSGGGAVASTGGGAEVTTPTETAGGAGGAGDEAPPATAKKGGGSASSSGSIACSVSEGSAPAGGLAVGLLLLAAGFRRRRD